MAISEICAMAFLLTVAGCEHYIGRCDVESYERIPATEAAYGSTRVKCQHGGDLVLADNIQMFPPCFEVSWSSVAGTLVRPCL